MTVELIFKFYLKWFKFKEPNVACGYWIVLDSAGLDIGMAHTGKDWIYRGDKVTRINVIPFPCQ